MRAEFHAERRKDRLTDMTKLMVAICNSVNETQSTNCCPQKTFLCLVLIIEQSAVLYVCCKSLTAFHNRKLLVFTERYEVNL
jgi:isoprenylcysteine carboxyl methyltransferase (ICMT) family protein YpbQ